MCSHTFLNFWPAKHKRMLAGSQILGHTASKSRQLGMSPSSRCWATQPGPMMTSSNGNIFRVTGPLRGEFTGHQWIPITKVSDAELRCFLWSAWINGGVNNREAGDLRCHRAHYYVTVMYLWDLTKSRNRETGCWIVISSTIKFDNATETPA